MAFDMIWPSPIRKGVMEALRVKVPLESTCTVSAAPAPTYSVYDRFAGAFVAGQTNLPVQGYTTAASATPEFDILFDTRPSGILAGTAPVNTASANQFQQYVIVINFAAVDAANPALTLVEVVTVLVGVQPEYS